MKVNTSLRTVTAFKLAGNRCTSIPVACGCQAGELWPALCMSEASVFRHDELREVKTGYFYSGVCCVRKINQTKLLLTCSRLVCTSASTSMFAFVIMLRFQKRADELQPF
eukprot:TRINITY_DN454_c0_g1_i1.p1 TRINITY_DN454_c0_g1~~TRINITY_DN454_c0_g1_i1.p1  ORF type:complete len:110 (+),score=6.73 TRINITY_DN454_c0_g1_i1:174-503(+)